MPSDKQLFEAFKEILQKYERRKKQWIEQFGDFDEKAYHQWFTEQIMEEETTI